MLPKITLQVCNKMYGGITPCTVK